MPARRILAPLALLAAVGLTGCGGDGSEAGAGDAAAAGAGGAPGGSGGVVATGGGGTGGASASGGTGGGPIAACPLSGWEPMPFLGPGCASACVPDDPAERLPKLEWREASWCAGCQELLTPWATDLGRDTQAVTGSVRAADGVFELGLFLSDGSFLVAWYDQGGTAVAGWHAPYGSATATSCAFFIASLRGLGGVMLHPDGADILTFIAPATEPDKLMRPSVPTYTFPKSFFGTRFFNEMWYSESMIAIDFGGRLAIADVRSGAAPVWADTLPGAQPGQIAEAVVAGDNVFVARWHDWQEDWYLYRDGALEPFLGTPEVDIEEVATDGQLIAWDEGSQPYMNGTRRTFARYDVYVAPFTTDPAELQANKRLLIPDLNVAGITIANGFVAGIFVADLERRRLGTVVARLSDGQVWRSVQPDPWASYGHFSYPAATELWGTSSYGNPLTARTVVRVPYGSMEAQ